MLTLILPTYTPCILFLPPPLESINMRMSPSPSCYPQSARCYPCSPQRRGYYFDAWGMGDQIQHTSEWQDLRHQRLQCSVGPFLRKACFCFMSRHLDFCTHISLPSSGQNTCRSSDPRSRTELSQSSESPGLISALLSSPAEGCPQTDCQGTSGWTPGGACPILPPLKPLWSFICHHTNIHGCIHTHTQSFPCS